MKKSFILSAILFGSLVYNNANAQVSVHIGFNIPARRVYVPAPPPQPVVVYDTDEFDDSDDYYYLPEVEAYYSIPRHCYYYQDGGRWISAAYLPGAYRNYDWRTARRFEIRGRRPYMRHDEYRGRWGGGFNRDWSRRDNYYAGRGFDNNRNNWNNRYDRPQGGFNQPNRDRGQGGWEQPNRNDNNGGGRDRGQGGWGQPNRNDNNGGGRDRSQGGWGQPNRNDNTGGGRDRGQGGWVQPNRNDNNGGGRDRGQGGWGQPSRNDNNGGGRDRGNHGGGNAQFAQNGFGHGDSHRQARF